MIWLLGLFVTLGDSQLIPGYSRSTLLFGGRVKFAWNLVGADSVKFAFEVGGYEWAALGFQRGSEKMTGDAIIVEPDGMNVYDITYPNIPVLKPPTPEPYYTNANYSYVGNVLRGEFQRTIAAPSPTSVPLTINSLKLMFAVCVDPFPAQHTEKTYEVVDLTATNAPTAPTTRAPSTVVAPTPVVTTTLGDFEHTRTVLSNGMKIGFTLNATHVKFGFESMDAEWIGLGFQDPTTETKMTGQAIIAQSSGTIAVYDVTHGEFPVARSDNGYITEAATGRIGNLLHASFVRSLAAPIDGTVSINNIRSVRIMLAYSTSAFPEPHSEREEIKLDLDPPSETSVAFSQLPYAPLLALVFLVNVF